MNMALYLQMENTVDPNQRSRPAKIVNNYRRAGARMNDMRDVQGTDGMNCPKESDCHDPACASGCKWARIVSGLLTASVNDIEGVFPDADVAEMEDER